MNVSKPKIIFASKNTAKKVIAAAADNKFIKNVINFDEKCSKNLVISYSSFVNDKKVCVGEKTVYPFSYINYIKLFLGHFK